MIPWDASWAQTWSIAAFPGMPRATTMRHPSSSISFLHATPRSLNPGTVRRISRTAPVTGTALELVDGLCAHVVAGEHRVGDTYAVHRANSHGDAVVPDMRVTRRTEEPG